MRRLDVNKVKIKMCIAMLIITAILDCANIVPVVISALIFLLIIGIFNIVEALKSNRTEKYLYIALNILIIIVIISTIIGWILKNIF